MSDIYNWLFEDAFFLMYAKDMRTGMFSGFLTIGGFLYSAHAFIVIHMKKEVYETPEHRQKIRDGRRAKQTMPFYGTLKNLSRLLIASTVSALVTSTSQFTIGLYHSNLAAIVCVSLSAVTMLLLALSIVVMVINFRAWFMLLESHAEKTSREESANTIR